MLAVWCLLLYGRQTAADISATFSTATVVNTYTWTLADLSQAAGGASVTVSYCSQHRQWVSPEQEGQLDSIGVLFASSCCPSLTGVRHGS